MEVCQTKRLKIRHFNEDDAGFILKLLNEESFIKNIGDKKVRCAEDAINYLRNGPVANYKKFGFGLNLVSLKDSNTPIGMCGLLKRNELEHPDLGYALLSEYCSKGYAQEASISVLKNVNDKKQYRHTSI
jgi:RimJ/RimL family protein N-acetyltransferase